VRYIIWFSNSSLFHKPITTHKGWTVPGPVLHIYGCILALGKLILLKGGVFVPKGFEAPLTTPQSKSHTTPWLVRKLDRNTQAITPPLSAPSGEQPESAEHGATAWRHKIAAPNA
jgi:hypothetical protein